MGPKVQRWHVQLHYWHCPLPKRLRDLMYYKDWSQQFQSNKWHILIIFLEDGYPNNASHHWLDWSICFFSGGIPSALKIPKVVKIHNNGDPGEINHYRAIGILPVLGTVVGKLVCNKLIILFDRFEVLCPQRLALGHINQRFILRYIQLGLLLMA